jgi:hypothetical protein
MLLVKILSKIKSTSVLANRTNNNINSFSKTLNPPCHTATVTPTIFSSKSFNTPPSTTTTRQHNDESALATQLLLHGLNVSRKQSSRKRRQAPQRPAPEMDPYTQAILKSVMPMWANNTWVTRSHLLLRFLRFQQQLLSTPHRSKPLGWQMAAFVVSTQTSPATKTVYARTLRTLAKRMGIQSLPVLDLLIQGQAVVTNMTPIRQAAPLPRSDMEKLLRTAWAEDKSMRLPLTLWLCWKTCSRWSDIANLLKANFIHFDLPQHELVIEWGDLKTNRRNRFKTYGLTVVREINHELMLLLLKKVVRKLPKDTPLSPMTTQQIRRWIRKALPISNYSAHSIKRGSLDILVEEAVAGNLDPRIIPIVAKHKDDLHDFPATTLRYISGKVALARMLRTAEATMLL